MCSCIGAADTRTRIHACVHVRRFRRRRQAYRETWFCHTILISRDYSARNSGEFNGRLLGSTGRLSLQLCVCRESCKESWLTRMVQKKASNQHQAKSAAFAS